MKRLRLAVTGLSGAGKTIFLTSMINFLLENGARHSPLFKERSRRLSAKELALDSDATRFTYEQYLQAFREKHPEWPKHTTEVSEFHLQLRLQKEGRRRVKKYRLELVDYPGEQLLDLPLLNKTYEEWSEEACRKCTIQINAELSQTFQQA